MVARIIKTWRDKWLITPGAKEQRQHDRGGESRILLYLVLIWY
jgi:hypothetical protein